MAVVVRWSLHAASGAIRARMSPRGRDAVHFLGDFIPNILLPLFTPKH
jgi:hypothetical protein